MDNRASKGIWVSCVWCQGHGCSVCESQRLQQQIRIAMHEEAYAFLKDLQKRMSADATEPSPASIELSMYAIQHGKQLVRAEREVLESTVEKNHWSSFIEFSNDVKKEVYTYLEPKRTGIEL